MKVIDIANKVSEVLQDLQRKSWTKSQLWEWIYDAELAVIQIRPDANPATCVIDLEPGTRQGIQSIDGALRTLDVVRNVDESGNPGLAIRSVDRKALDLFNPGWHKTTAVAEPTEYVFDDRDPQTFYVNPPSDGDGHVETVCSMIPAEYDEGDSNQTITVNDTYVPAMIEWALYRCFSRDSEKTPNGQRAQLHLNNFKSLMGMKANSDIASSPRGAPTNG